MDIKSKVSKSIAVCFIGLLFAFILTWIIFDFQKSSSSLKDTWIIISSLFSGACTLIAAYIASLLFNDWRVQHNHTILKDLANNIFTTYSNLSIRLVAINDTFAKTLKQNIMPNKKYNYTRVMVDIEPEMKVIGDLLLELLKQIEFINFLHDNKIPVLSELKKILLEYIEVMDITYYKDIADHDRFAIEEKLIKSKLDNIEDAFYVFLKGLLVIKIKKY